MKFCSILLAGHLSLESIGLIGNSEKDTIMLASMCTEKKNVPMHAMLLSKK